MNSRLKLNSYPSKSTTARAASRFACWLILLLAMSLSLTWPLTLLAQNNLERPPDIPPEGAPQSQPLSLPEDAAPNTDEAASAQKKEAPLPPKVQDEQLDPVVTIRDEEGKRVEEYSRGGQIYMIKVIPDKGVPYYYVDTDGDGSLETSPTKDLEQVRPVFWKVKEWN